MDLFVILAISFFAVCVFFFVAGYFCFVHACKRSRKRDPAARGYINTSRYKEYEREVAEELERYKEISAHGECVEIKSHDGLTLRATYIPSPSFKKKLVIVFHGYRSCAEADFGCIIGELIGEGISVLAVDQRSHGRSEGKYVTFGTHEKYDCRDWCRYAFERFVEDVDIYIYGVSMGGATVLMASALELPPNVRGVIADCPFTTPWEIIKRRLWRRYRVPVYPTIYFMNYWSRQLASFDFRGDSSEESARSELPILIFHGKADSYVPISMSERIFSALGEKASFVKFDGAGHARSYLSDKRRYLYEFLRFIYRNE